MEGVAALKELSASKDTYEKLESRETKCLSKSQNMNSKIAMRTVLLIRVYVCVRTILRNDSLCSF